MQGDPGAAMPPDSIEAMGTPAFHAAAAGSNASSSKLPPMVGMAAATCTACRGMATVSPGMRVSKSVRTGFYGGTGVSGVSKPSSSGSASCTSEETSCRG